MSFNTRENICRFKLAFESMEHARQEEAKKDVCVRISRPRPHRGQDIVWLMLQMEMCA